MNLHLSNKLALVTASTGGIGLAIATSLAAEGAEVIVNGRSSQSVEQAMNTIKATVPNATLHSLVADNATAEGNAATVAAYPSVDILINNLGIYESVEFLQSTDEQWQNILEVNVMSGVRLSRHYLGSMLKQDSGRIIFISSESAVNPAPEMAHYSATKTMQMTLSRSMAELTKGTQVTVNTVMPGSTRTEGVQKFVQNLFPELEYAEAERKFMADNRATSLIARLIDPQEIADFTTFLSSPLSAAMNGAAVRVDGGIVRSVF
ncbi:SDR family NAD(P)-dependent oxidoreductase [Shewanella intestini]|uniref:SDR family oxidoreductase n=1 Tax=Shewanella intestini TaxID=2017544 RepID=A0ABS5I547_9GAMM|nr:MULTISPECIES: SDR family oxidoreductase [Shewanella]MBR9728435.1 SDR family oxidoreductase [Shewanella intestini]MRG36777.1 SDR family NAD(P)-dependent oxidoreductase [Shewanella sp. XMDDZSB0408]